MRTIRSVILIVWLLLTIIPYSLASPLPQEADGHRYVVQTDDWLSKLADKYYQDVSAWPAIWLATNTKAKDDDSFTSIADPNHIEIGQILWIPPKTEVIQLLAHYQDPILLEEEESQQEIINALSTSLPIEEFREILGTHLFYRVSKKGYAEYVFARPGYWVQAITNSENSVLFYAITSCDEHFRPVLYTTTHAEAGIQLQETTWKAVSKIPDERRVNLGNTANSYVYEIAYGGEKPKRKHLGHQSAQWVSPRRSRFEYIKTKDAGLSSPGSSPGFSNNSSDQQTLTWGLNDVCYDYGKLFEDLDSNWQTSRDKIFNSKIDYDDPLIDQWRSNYSFNTMGIGDVNLAMSEFQIGVDRVQVRVYPGGLEKAATLPDLASSIALEGQIEEQEVINALSTLITIEKFEEILGSPQFHQVSANGHAEYIFARQGYWVQAITDEHGTVWFYGITSCDEQFRPIIREIQLRETTFAEALPHRSDSPLHFSTDTIFYSFSSDNELSYLFVPHYMGNPGLYQTMIIGHTDACPSGWNDESFKTVVSMLTQQVPHEIHNEWITSNSFNTFGLLGAYSLETLLQEFQIGVKAVPIK